MLKSFLKNEEGATAIEYVLIVAIVSVAVLAGAGPFADALKGVFINISTKLSTMPMP